jgi:three-Cys-motif partner protein
MTFFEKPTEHSLVKAEIVAAYFERWANIMALKQSRISYLDLYAGPGQYEDGHDSTPMLVLKAAIRSPRLRNSLEARFNDANANHAAQLEANIAALDGVDLLRYRPVVSAEEIGERVATLLRDTRMPPTLTFLDPWGYAGLSRDLIRGALKDFGCEVIFFFNYSGFVRAIGNPGVQSHMRSFFSDARLATIQSASIGMTPDERESYLMREVGETVSELGGRHLIPFRFLRSGGRNLHYIVFATKHPKGYEKMKEVMWIKGIRDEDGVPRFEYLPTAAGRQLPFGSQRPLGRLAADLLSRFRGRELTFQALFDEHQVDTPFVVQNYKVVLEQMESAGRVGIEDRRKGTLAPSKRIRFPD